MSGVATGEELRHLPGRRRFPRTPVSIRPVYGFCVELPAEGGKRQVPVNTQNPGMESDGYSSAADASGDLARLESSTWIRQSAGWGIQRGVVMVIHKNQEALSHIQAPFLILNPRSKVPTFEGKKKKKNVMLWLFPFISPSIPLSVLSLSLSHFFPPYSFSSSCTQTERHGRFQNFWPSTFVSGPVPITRVSLFFPPVMGACCSGSRNAVCE